LVHSYGSNNSYLASQEIAWKETWRRRGFVEQGSLTDETNWGAAATKGATTMVHIDDAGFGTAITMLAGSKYWVVMRSKPDAKKGEVGDLASINAFPEEWDYGHTGAEIWDAEGILLEAGDTL
jgi:hypothetical protein